MKRAPLNNQFYTGRPRVFYVRFLIIITIILIFYYYYFRASKQTGSSHAEDGDFILSEAKQMEPEESFREAARIVHLDLKGAPPKISYYKKLFPLLSKMGATGLLIEYEDMFPYSGPVIGNISALNAYTLNDIKLINVLAAQNNLEIIPLVQTFGHLEFLLKLEQFKELREVFEYPQVICPTHYRTKILIKEMLEQVIRAHPDSKRIHIGADEVYYLGLCDRCANALIKYNMTKSQLFLEHVDTVTELIVNHYPKLEILMWDDEFRNLPVKELHKTRLGKIVQPVVWKYAKEVYEYLGPTLWDMYEQTFPKLWIASAFKGATGSNQYVCDTTHYVQNHRSWMGLVSEYKSRINFQGIIITGWQRYDHFAVLCELLPVSLPSLAMSLRVVLGYKDSPLNPPQEVARILGCEQPYGLIGPAFGSPKCSYPGGEILEAILRLQQLKQEFDTILEDSRVKGWMDTFNIEHGYSNPNHVQYVTSPLGRIRGELMQIDSELEVAMDEVYDNYTIYEWRETYIKPFEVKVNELWAAREKILAKSSWPRRPLGPLNKNEL